MTASSQSGQTNVTRKVMILAICIVVFIALYCAAWFYAAHRLKFWVGSQSQAENSEKVSGQCADMEVRGFPFRIGLFCSGVSIDDHTNGISASLGALRSAAQVYAPGHIISELDQPAVIRTALGATFSAEWASLRSSIRTGLGGLKEANLTSEGLKANLMAARDAGMLTIDASHAEAHVRQNGGDLDAAVLFQQAGLTQSNVKLPLPPLSASADVTVAGKGGLIDGSVPAKAEEFRGTSGEIRRLVADLGNGQVVTVSGPFSIDKDGLISAQIDLTIEKVDDMRKTLKAGFPDIWRNIDMVGKLLKSMGDDSGTVNVKLNIQNGVMMLSFIPILNIPPI